MHKNTGYSERRGEAVAELLFATIEELGMSSGNYIGRLDVLGTEGSRGEKTPLEEFIYASNKYVFLNPLAIAEGITGALYDAPHIAVTGKQGKENRSWLACSFYIVPF